MPFMHRMLQRMLRTRIIRALAFIFVVWNVAEVHYISSRLQQGSAAFGFSSGPGPGSGSESGSESELDPSAGGNQDGNQRRSNEQRWQLAIDHLQQSLHLQRPPRVYIASLHWNNEQILRSHWNAAVLDLVRALGPSNVFVSVQEGGSWDNSAGVLRELDASLAELGAPREILLDRTTHEDEVSAHPSSDTPGWIDTPRGKHELRRIPYLARLRNRSLDPLHRMAAAVEDAGADTATANATKPVPFDRVLFLNDVVFTVDDVLALLATNDGQYAAACSLDFSKPPLYYDTFALRDWDGHEHATQTWPYFRSARSRRAIKLSVPVPVRSCWNGMVAVPARLFTAEENPLAFRGVDDSLALHHIEGSECCLIHADNPLAATRGVFLNPNVRVGYNGPAYEAVHPSDGHAWLSPMAILKGLWWNRMLRLSTTPALKEWRVHRLVNRWIKEGKRKGESRVENGEFCLINEMQVLVGNGWAHV